MVSLKENKGFASLNVLQAFGAANDNIFKQLVIMAVTTGGIWSYQFGLNGEFYISLFFSAPFILLAGFLGQFSDKYSKRSVIIVVKLWEVLLALCCIAALYAGRVLCFTPRDSEHVIFTYETGNHSRIGNP